MIDGLNENIEVLGRSFHVQTEVVEGAECTCRTTVFAGGVVIGQRSSVLDSGLSDDVSVRARMQEQHTQIVENLVARLQEFADDEDGAEVEPPTPLSDRRPLPKKEVARPSIDDDPGLRSSVRVRSIIAEFRNRIDVEPPADTAELALRLKRTAEQAHSILESRVFPEIRLDEQVRFYDLAERLDLWLAHEPDHDSGVTIWADIVVFSAYLGRINNRQELIEFDRKLLLWAFGAIGSGGVTPEIVEALRDLCGREPRFDGLLDDPGRGGRQTWLELLVEMLDSL